MIDTVFLAGPVITAGVETALIASAIASAGATAYSVDQQQEAQEEAQKAREKARKKREKVREKKESKLEAEKKRSQQQERDDRVSLARRAQSTGRSLLMNEDGGSAISGSEGTTETLG